MTRNKEGNMNEQQSPAPTDGEGSTAEQVPPMNRAERRAAAKGKKSGPANAHGAPQSANTHQGRPGAVAAQMRLPRTGHKGA
jgi:hypothetical protein